MIFTKLFAIVAVVAATNVLATPADGPAALEKRQGLSCTFGGNLGCNVVCKQEGKTGGHCDENDTCICNPSKEKRQGLSCTLGGDLVCNVVCKQEGKGGGHCDENDTCICN